MNTKFGMDPYVLNGESLMMNGETQFNMVCFVVDNLLDNDIPLVLRQASCDVAAG